MHQTWWFVLKYDVHNLPKAVQATQLSETQLQLANGVGIVGMHTNMWDYWPSYQAALDAQRAHLEQRVAFTVEQYERARLLQRNWQLKVLEAQRQLEDDGA